MRPRISKRGCVPTKEGRKIRNAKFSNAISMVFSSFLFPSLYVSPCLSCHSMSLYISSCPFMALDGSSWPLLSLHVPTNLYMTLHDSSVSSCLSMSSQVSCLSCFLLSSHVFSCPLAGRGLVGGGGGAGCSLVSLFHGETGVG